MSRPMEPPCILFCRLNVGKPEEVGAFLYWLWHGEWPGEQLPNPNRKEMEQAEQELEEELSVNPWKAIEWHWGLQAPRKRMARLLWQLLQNADEAEFQRRFTAQLHYLVEDAERCAEILPPIQERVRRMLDAYMQRLDEDRDIGQGAWGEEWWLPRAEAGYLREQIRRAQLDLLEQPSDYEEALKLTLQMLYRRIGGIEILCRDPARVYVGVREAPQPGADLQLPLVFVEGGGERYPLLNVRDWTAGTNFEWGYGGGGPAALAESILVDATDGFLGLPDKLIPVFLTDFLLDADRNEIRIRRHEILAWLSRHGYTEERLAQELQAVEMRRRKLQAHVDEIRKRLDRIGTVQGGRLRAQRLDLVPQDFESALCIDFVEMLRRGEFALRCNWCGLSIAGNSSRANRLWGRWRSGRPIYHEACAVFAEKKRKTRYWRRRSQDPVFRERERQRLREYRKS